MVSINNLNFSYQKNNPIFENMGLELAEGHIYGLLGKNGVGKSTLLKLLSGMVFTSGGEISVMSYKPQRRQPSFMSSLYYLTEEIYSPNMTIRAYASLLAPLYPTFSMNLLGELITDFEIDTRQKITRMSLGNKKKVAIAIALACNTPLLLMDEPTNGLDIPSKSVFRRVIARYASPERCIIISTHQVRDLENLIDAYIIMDNRKIVINKTASEIASKLSFGLLTENVPSLYEETNIMGRWGIMPNLTGEDSKIDIELLFNASVAHKQKIIDALK